MSHFILAVERERTTLNFIRSAMIADEFDVISAMSRRDALLRGAAWSPSAAIVGGSFGLEAAGIVRDLQREFSVRTLLIAKPGQEEIVAPALEAGAMGFIVAPFTRAELSSRVREAIAAHAVTDGRYLTAGPVTIDLDRRSVLRPKPSSPLTPCEFEMLRWFLTPPGRTFTRRQLMATRRSSFAPGSSEKLVDGIVASLRNKLGSAGECIESSGDLGWRLVLSESEILAEMPLTNVNYGL